ncbi:MAG: hypothetical protein FWD61_20600, partial [Phycisphaerales bacterium]|nr:hypothetical protein [Phycisphaerales bacterium]
MMKLLVELFGAFWNKPVLIWKHFQSYSESFTLPLMNILITGSSGQIGTNLALALQSRGAPPPPPPPPPPTPPNHPTQNPHPTHPQ